MIVLGAGDLGAGKTTGARNLDTLCAKTHGSADCLLHSTAERDSVFKLRSDALCNQLCVDVGILDLNNIDNNRATDHCFKLGAKLFDLDTAAADNHTGLCAVDEYANAHSITLDFELGSTCCLELLLEVLSDLVVRYQGIAELFVLCEPSGIPLLDHADAQAVRIYLLSHVI